MVNRRILSAVIFLSYLSLMSSAFLKDTHKKMTVALQTKLSLVNVKCFYVQDKHVYTFQNLENDDEDYVNSYTNPNLNGKVYYNFCRDTLKTCPAANGEEKHGSTLIFEGAGKCIRLSGTIDGDDGKNTWKEFEEKTEVATRKGLYLTLAGGDFCDAAKTKRYTTTYKIYCNNDIEDKKFKLNFDSIDPERCENYVEGEAYDACSTNNLLRLKKFLDENKYLVGIGMIVIGFFLLAMGGKLFKIIICIMCGLALSLIASILIFSLFTVETELQFWLIIGIPFVIGVLIGILLLKIIKIAIFIQGACAGYPFGILLYQLVIKFVSWRPDILYWIVIIVCMIVFGILALLFLKLAIIVSTSIIGGYMVIKGFSFFFGKFPDESELIALIKAKEKEQLKEIMTYHVYIYLVAWIILTVGGIMLQLHLCKGLTDEDFSGDKKEYREVPAKED
ncbi:MAG: TMEM198/TM7SF3 family protein [archaeon]|nr:TMEM198/TM7SF3 family protein [archaeon]